MDQIGEVLSDNRFFKVWNRNRAQLNMPREQSNSPRHDSITLWDGNELAATEGDS
jgi:hypothetical protein